MTNASDFFDMRAAPMRIGKVRLKVRDLGSVSGFYQSVLGLTETARSNHEVTLGTVGGTPLLVLQANTALTPADRDQAGLFHTAFLMPTRADLALWLGHVAQTRVRLQGASVHIVSEAIYLSDPEGNGIEVYADRPLSRWIGADGNIRMTTDPLDMQDLLAAGAGSAGAGSAGAGSAGAGSAGEGAAWIGFPEKGCIGHVHMRVGDTVAADRFYRDILGFEVTVDYPGASFYGSGGYHHQLAGNVWSSRGATRRPEAAAGLDVVELLIRDHQTIADILSRAQSAGLEATNNGAGSTLHDPWGTAITLRSSHAPSAPGQLPSQDSQPEPA